MSAAEAPLEVVIAHTTPCPVGLLPAGPINIWLPQRGMYASPVFCEVL
jgi:hypothetical protein